ncbi:hypothetical protein ACFVY9_19760 [Streptomyces sp. NPDC059544]|uniref:hypothetical protein n=1 Tax=Streptomyces sp. NPDC059544 TaxID=3346861 RepID=UPI0036B9C898
MTLTRGARATGAVLCAVLAALAASWIVRDLRTADDLSALWWFWAGDGRTLLSARQLTTTLHDPLLLLGCAVAGLAALRSRAAAGALVAAAVVTFAVRLPGLWLLSAHWMDLRATGELRGRALVSVFTSLAVAVGLIITVVAGRRPADAPLGATAYGASSQEPPHGAGPCAPGTPHPSRGALLTVFVLLTAAAAVRAAWELYWTAQLPASSYAGRFTGRANLLLPLLGTPPGWLNTAVVAISLTAAGGALLRASFARPLGLAAAGLLTASGVSGIALAARLDLLGHFGTLPTVDRLTVGSWVGELAAGAVTFAVLARGCAVADPTAVDGLRPGHQDRGREPGRPADAGPGPPPPSSPPPGW